MSVVVASFMDGRDSSGGEEGGVVRPGGHCIHRIFHIVSTKFYIASIPFTVLERHYRRFVQLLSGKGNVLLE